MPSDDDWTKHYALSLTNGELANILEFSSFYHDAEIAVVAMREAAKRLREQPEPHYVSPPVVPLSPLMAYAVSEPVTDSVMVLTARPAP